MNVIIIIIIYIYIALFHEITLCYIMYYLYHCVIYNVRVFYIKSCIVFNFITFTYKNILRDSFYYILIDWSITDSLYLFKLVCVKDLQAHAYNEICTGNAYILFNDSLNDWRILLMSDMLYLYWSLWPENRVDGWILKNCLPK